MYSFNELKQVERIDCAVAEVDHHLDSFESFVADSVGGHSDRGDRRYIRNHVDSVAHTDYIEMMLGMRVDPARGNHQKNLFFVGLVGDSV